MSRSLTMTLQVKDRPDSACYTTRSEPSPDALDAMDRQNRVGSKFGGGGIASADDMAREQRARAAELFDVDQDPYVVRNHLGQFVCKLCMTVHPNLPNYVAHTQGRRHQTGLQHRAALAAQQAAVAPEPAIRVASGREKRAIKIGRPGYRVIKQRDPSTSQRSLLFEISYPDIEEDAQPRHRFMSAYEQRKETPDRQWQYLLFAAPPYETVAFKIPSDPLDRREGRFFTDWNPTTKLFRLQLFFRDTPTRTEPAGAAAAAAAVSASRA